MNQKLFSIFQPKSNVVLAPLELEVAAVDFSLHLPGLCDDFAATGHLLEAAYRGNSLHETIEASYVYAQPH